VRLRGKGDALEYSYRNQRLSGDAMKRFRPGIVPTLVVALLLPMLVSLGFWQLSRGAEKSALLQSYAERRAAEPMASTELLHTEDPAFRRVRIHGQFDAAHSLLLDNRQRDGKVGVELLQPFQDQATGLWLLVNRGWLPWPDRRTPPQFTTPTQALSLDAWVYVSPGATFQLHADPSTTTWPQLITAVEPAKLWTALDRDGFAYELRAEAGPASYQADWPVVAMGPEKHIAYAVQWFAMSIALFGLYLYLGWHNAKEKHHGSGHESTQHV
jgi:surfeit locus 1 family protein